MTSCASEGGGEGSCFRSCGFSTMFKRLTGQKLHRHRHCTPGSPAPCNVSPAWLLPLYEPQSGQLCWLHACGPGCSSWDEGWPETTGLEWRQYSVLRGQGAVWPAAHHFLYCGSEIKVRERSTFNCRLRTTPWSFKQLLETLDYSLKRCV